MRVPSEHIRLISQIQYDDLDAGTKPDFKQAVVKESNWKDDMVIGRSALKLGDAPLFIGKNLFLFFERLSKLGKCSKNRLIRIVHFGDSHTAADVLPSTIRRVLQTRFGDGGRGFQFLGKPWRTFRLLDAVVDAKGEWQTYRAMLTKKSPSLDGRYGLGGVAIESRQKGATVTLGTSKKTPYCSQADHFEIFYLKQPGGGVFSVLVDGKRIGKVYTKSNRYKTGFREIDLQRGPHQIDIRVSGRGKVRLFGAAMEQSRSGLVYDVLGINGAFFYTPLKWDMAIFKDQMRRRDPDLIITMYGANEMDARNLMRHEYLRRVRKSMRRLLRGAPRTSCLILGPTDRKLKRHPDERELRMNLVRDVQKQVAYENRCGFMDLAELMGGTGAMERWQSAGYAQSDGVHFNFSGYRLLGKMVAAQLLNAFDAYQARQKEEQCVSLESDGGV